MSILKFYTVTHYATPFLLMDNIFFQQNIKELILDKKIHAIIQTTTFLLSYYCNNPTVINVLDVISSNVYYLYRLCGIDLNDKYDWKNTTNVSTYDNNNDNVNRNQPILNLDFRSEPEKCFYYFENNHVEKLEEMNFEEILVQLRSETFDNIQSELVELEKVHCLIATCIYNTIGQYDTGWKNQLENSYNFENKIVRH